MDAIARLYEDDNAYISAEAHISLERRSRLYARHHLDILGKFSGTGSLLEIGAGAGYFLDEARNRGYEPYAIEFNPTQSDFVRTKLEIPCDQAALSTGSFGGKAFDVIYHSDVISHFYDPIEEIRKMNSALRPGGWMIFETGNAGDVDPKYFKHIEAFQYPDHLFFFSLKNLRDLLDQTGFDLVELHTYSVVPQLMTVRVLHWAKRLLKPRVPVASSAYGVAEAPAVGRSPANDVSRNATAVKQRPALSDYANYLLRYKLGAVVPKSSRPQTLVVVARARPA
jgi:SAM-dependent methyltransferase